MNRRWLLVVGVVVIGLGVGWRLERAYVPFVYAEREVEDEDEGWDDDQPIVAPPVVAPEPEPDATPETTDASPANTTTETVTGVTPETPAATSAPVTTTTTVATVSTEFPWPWILARSLGIASFLLLSLLSITGILLTTGVLFRIMSPANAWSTHRAIGSVLLFSVLGHITGLLLDRFMNLRLIDVLVPFVSPFQRLYVSFGIFGFYLMLLIIASTLYTMTRYARFWRTVHFFAFPMYLLIFIHGVLIGTDSHRWWMQVIFWGSGILVGAAVMYRLIWKYRAAKA